MNNLNQNFEVLGGVVEERDLALFIEQTGEEPVIVRVAPVDEDGIISPHSTLFLRKDGQVSLVTGIKPVYYLHRNGQHRPMREVCVHYGNTKIILNEKWRDIHPAYMRWLAQRQRRFGTELLIPSMFLSVKTRQRIDSAMELVPLALVLALSVAHPSAFPMMPFFMGDTITVYPATGANDPVDGSCTRGSYPDGVVESHATIRAGAGTSASSTASNNQVSCECASTTPNFELFTRAIHVFDTSAIGAADTVTATTFSFTGASKGDEGSGTPDMHAFWATTAANNAIATGDFVNNQASGSLGSIAYGDIVVGADSTTYNVITLSAYNNINKGTGARTKIGLGHKWDVLNNTTGYTWGAHKNSYVSVYFADATTASDPKLFVTYTVAASGPANLKSLDTNLKANIKSYNTNLIANIKSINTNV